MTEEERYRTAWSDRSRRGLIVVSLLFVGATVVIMPALFAREAELENLATPSLVFIAIWMLALSASGIYASRFRCPRCNHRFTANQKGPRYMSYCTNCGLPAGSGPGTFVDPNFSKSN
jgi:hypothetical protein